MIPYRKWKFLNESIFNRTLGITNHQSLGLISPFLTAQDGAQEVTSNQDGEESVLVDEKRSHGKKKKSETETCKYCGSKMKKEHMDEDEYEGDEGEREEDDEYEGEGDEEDEGEEEGGEGEDEEGEGEDEEGEGEDEEGDEGDMDESKKHKSKKGMKYMKDMKCMSCMGKDEDEGDMGDFNKHKSKKGMMYMKDMKESFKYNFMKGKKGKKGKKVGKKSEGDVAADGSIDAMVKKLVKKGMPEKFAMVIAKKKAEKAKNESSWMNDIFGGDPNKKNYDGINEMVDDHYGVDDDSFINPPDENDEDDDPGYDNKSWDREGRLMDAANSVMSKVGEKIDSGEFEHPEWKDSGSVPEFHRRHGNGDPDGMKSHLEDIAKELPSDLRKELLDKIGKL